MKVDEALVKHVASLAKLSFSDDELSSLTKDFSEIIKAFEILQEADTQAVGPTRHPVSDPAVLRDDDPIASISQSQALQFTTDQEDGFFVGPKTL